VHFLGVAHGSICELETQLYVSLELKFTEYNKTDFIISEIIERQNKKSGMVTACVGGGQGVAGVYELLK
jgi:four helix bundle protein